MLTRMALGATRWRIALQVGVETAILAVAGSVLGMIVGLEALAWLHDRVAAMQPAGALFPGWDRLGLDGPLLFYVIALTAAFTFGVGLLPALVTRTQLASALGGIRQRQDGRRANGLRRLLVVAEMAMAFVLVIMAGLLVRSFVTLDRVGTGYDGKNLYWVEAGSLPSDRYRSNAAERTFFTQLGARLRAIPGVAAVGESSIMLLNDNEDTAYRLAGDRDGAPPRFANINVVAPKYFRTLGVPLLRGRDFSAFDGAKAQPVAIVSRRFALHAFGTLNVVGREVGVSMSSDGTYPLRRIVGVVGDVRHGLMRQPALEIYAPLDQIAWSRGFVVRTSKALPGLAASVAAVVRSMDPMLPPPAVDSYAAIRGLDAMPVSMTAVVLATLAVIALLLALSGVYGVVAFSVARRTREFGIRLALGAQASQVLASVVAESLLLTAIAVVAGLALCVPTTRALGEFLVDTSPLDPLTICGVTVLIFACSVAASVGPARKAMSTDPVTALRYE
jgi:putative ABC transport system permease protein